MTELAPEAPPTEAPVAQTPVEDGTDWRAESRKWEQRAKDNQAKAREFERQQQAAMSDSERAIAEAKQAGRAEAASESARDLARARFDAFAVRRNPTLDEKQLDGLVEYIDMSRFLGEDGRPDSKALAAAVERLIPAPIPSVPGLDLGARGPAATGGDFNQVLRQAAGRA